MIVARYSVFFRAAATVAGAERHMAVELPNTRRSVGEDSSHTREPVARHSFVTGFCIAEPYIVSRTCGVQDGGAGGALGRMPA